MKKKDLVESISKQCDISKTTASDAIDIIFQSITDAINNDEKVDIKGFGSFNISDRKARKGRNPHTGEEIEIKASRVPTFKASKTLKDYCNKYMIREYFN